MRLLLILLLAPSLWAADSDLIRQWSEAAPAERGRLRERIEADARRRGFVEARCVLVTVGERVYTLAELFTQVLEPALLLEPDLDASDDFGLRPQHLIALDALNALRKVYEPPAPVSVAALNLLLAYGRDALHAWKLPPRVRLRFFMQVLSNVRALEGRVLPDETTGWIVHDGILPLLLGMGRRFPDHRAIRESISEAASLLSLPSVLDESAQSQLAALATGAHARTILLRAYRRGRLDDLGVRALTRSAIAQARDDDAFLAGAAPLILELLSDDRVPTALRAEIVKLLLNRMAAETPLRATAAELLAAAYGEIPQSMDAWRGRFERSGVVPRVVGSEVYRFLQVVLLRRDRDGSPEPVRVVRRDVKLHQSIRAADGTFVGMLVRAADGEHADFLGPSPGLRGVPDNRLLRRTLVLERIAIRFYGARDEEMELSVALPRDESEPVPLRGARLSHVLDIVRERLERTQSAEEKRGLVDLLVRIGTPAARELAVKHSVGAANASSLLELLETGDQTAAPKLLERVADLDPAERERALAAILAVGDADLRAKVVEFAQTAPIEVAALAADALMQDGAADGVFALLRHTNRYARLCGVALSLRLTTNAGSLRIHPREKVDMEALAKATAAAFPSKMGGIWRGLGKWLPAAIREPEKVRSKRGDYLGLGPKRIAPSTFARNWTAHVRDGKQTKAWRHLPPYLLDPVNPGREIRPERMEELLDALEKRLERADLRRSWIDTFAVLAAVQSGLEFDTEYLELARIRLKRIAGKGAPAAARRKPGIYWPIWAAKNTK